MIEPYIPFRKAIPPHIPQDGIVHLFYDKDTEAMSIMSPDGSITPVGESLFGGLQMLPAITSLVEMPGNHTVSAADSGKFFVKTGGAGDYITFPEPIPGVRFFLGISNGGNSVALDGQAIYRDAIPGDTAITAISAECGVMEFEGVGNIWKFTSSASGAVGHTAPVNGAGSSATVNFTGNPIDGNTISLSGFGFGSEVFTFRDSPSGPFDIQIGVDEEATVINAASVITSDSSFCYSEPDGLDLVIFTINVGNSDNYGIQKVGSDLAITQVFLGGTDGTLTPPYIRTAGGFLYVQEDGLWRELATSPLTV